MSAAKRKLPVATIWITGLSASGKTTTGERLNKSLEDLGYDNFIWLDGEELRKRLDRKYGYSPEERFEVAVQIVEEVGRLQSAGYLVIVSTISHTLKMRELARKRCARFYEVHLKCPVDVCAERDFKGNYKKALAGEMDCFVGVTAEYEESERPELTLDTASLSREECAHLLLTHVMRFLERTARNE